MAWLTRNWHLKLSAMALAAVLYTGFVFSGAFTEATWRGVPIQTIEPPPSTHLLSMQPITVDVRYRVDQAEAPRVGADANVFAATVDLSRYDLGQAGQPQALPVVVRSLSDSVTVLGHEPTEISVVLDTVETRSVPVAVEIGPIPDGLEIGEPVLDQTEVEVVGPRSQVRQVDRVVARVRIDPSGLDVRRSFELEPIAIDTQRVENVEVVPSSVEVRIAVRALETTKTVPIRPVVTGSPAAGFTIGTVTVEPSVVTIRGQPDVLEEVIEIETGSLSVAGVTDPQTFEAGLLLPDGTRLADGGEGDTVSVEVAVVPVPSSRTFAVAVACQGVVPAGSACLPLTEQVAVTLSGSPGSLDALTAADLIPVADAAGLGPGTHNVSLTLTLPAGVQLLGISPPEVSVQVVPPQPPPTPPPPTPTPEPTPEP